MVANIFGQIFAKGRKIDAQQRVSSIIREITRVSKNISRAERQANQQKRAATNEIKRQFSIFTTPQIQANVAAQMKGNAEFADLFNEDGSMNYKNQALWQQFNEEVNTQKMIAQNNMQQQLDQIEEQYEQFQEITIQGLKDEQTDLEAEKLTAENDVKLYEGMEQTEKQFADSNIKGMFSNG